MLVVVAVVAVILAAATWPGAGDEGSPRPVEADSAFVRGDASGSTIEGNDSDAKHFIDGPARNAIIRNNSHLHKWWSRLMAQRKLRSKAHGAAEVEE